MRVAGSPRTGPRRAPHRRNRGQGVGEGNRDRVVADSGGHPKNARHGPGGIPGGSRAVSATKIKKGAERVAPGLSGLVEGPRILPGQETLLSLAEAMRGVEEEVDRHVAHGGRAD